MENKRGRKRRVKSTSRI